MTQRLRPSTAKPLTINPKLGVLNHCIRTRDPQEPKNHSTLKSIKLITSTPKNPKPRISEILLGLDSRLSAFAAGTGGEGGGEGDLCLDCRQDSRQSTGENPNTETKNVESLAKPPQGSQLPKESCMDSGWARGTGPWWRKWWRTRVPQRVSS